MKITIIGAAGVLGSSAAFNLIVNKLCGEIIMIDPWVNMLKAHWMDLSTAAVKLRATDCIMPPFYFQHASRLRG